MKKRLHMELHLLRESWLRQCKKILFDFLKKRQYNYKKRVASKRKSSLPATRFFLQKVNIAMKKCVACQRKSSLYDKVRTFFV